MKKILLIKFFLLMSCSDYIVDPRGSKEPQEIIRDKIECRTIIKENLNAFVRVIDGPKLMKTCLKGRGHSILN